MAILKRGKAQGLFKKLREAFWPSQGWRRTLSYYRHRLFRTGDSTYKITAGLAAGAAISFVPLIGTHFIQAGLFAFIMRGSVIAGFLGTAVGNPWTFPLMFWLAYQVGIFLMGLAGWTEFTDLPDFMTTEFLTHQPLDFMKHLATDPWRLFLPMLVGGYVCAILAWPVYYGLLYYPVTMMQRTYRSERVQRLLKRRGKNKDSA